MIMLLEIAFKHIKLFFTDQLIMSSGCLKFDWATCMHENYYVVEAVW